MDEQYEVHAQLGAAAARPGFDDDMLAQQRLVVRLRAADLYGLVRRR